jgi:hypothetical protein
LYLLFIFIADNEIFLTPQTNKFYYEFFVAENFLPENRRLRYERYSAEGHQSPKEAFEPHIFRFMPHGRDVRGFL